MTLQDDVSQQKGGQRTGVPFVERSADLRGALDGFAEKDSFLQERDNELQVSVTSNGAGDEEVNNADYTFCHRLKADHPFRRRFVHSLWMFWAYMGMGWMAGQIGPSLTDLRGIVQQDLETVSWLFTVFSSGYLTGSFVGGMLYGRFNTLLLIAFSTLLMAVFTATLPWCRWFPLMIASRFMSGLGAGGLGTGGNADLLSLWREEGRPYMQALHFCYGVGGIISPLVTEPFLAKKHCIVPNDTETSALFNNDNKSTTMNTSDPTSVFAISYSSNTTCQEVYGQTSIHYAFLFSFFLIGSSTTPFIVMYVRAFRTKTPQNMTAETGGIARPDKLPLKLKATLLILLCGLLLCYNGVEETYSGFLATYCINYFNWSKATSSFATSLQWAAFSLGRFSGIFLVGIFKPAQLLCVYFLSLIVSFIGLAIASHTFITELAWMFIPLAGLSMSICFASMFFWTKESIMKVTGKVSSVLLIASSLGVMLNPPFLGYLMETFSNIWFVYLLLGESSMCFILFVTIYVIVKKFV